MRSRVPLVYWSACWVVFDPAGATARDCETWCG